MLQGFSSAWFFCEFGNKMSFLRSGTRWNSRLMFRFSTHRNYVSLNTSITCSERSMTEQAQQTPVSLSDQEQSHTRGQGTSAGHRLPCSHGDLHSLQPRTQRVFLPYLLWKIRHGSQEFGTKTCLPFSSISQKLFSKYPHRPTGESAWVQQSCDVTPLCGDRVKQSIHTTGFLRSHSVLQFCCSNMFLPPLHWVFWSMALPYKTTAPNLSKVCDP